MKLLILTGGFPSEDNPAKSIFNYRAVTGLMSVAEVLVVHLRYWRPGRPLIKKGSYQSVDVITLALPWIPVDAPALNAFNLVVWQWLVYFLMRRTLRSYDVLHSIGLETAPIGAFLSAKSRIAHFAQAIGSDLLYHLPRKEPYFGIARWSQGTRAVICNSGFLKQEVNRRYPGMPAEVAYRGTDLSRYTPVSRAPSKVVQLLFLGGFSDRRGTGYGSDLKGGETLKKVWEAIDAIGTVEATLWLGGPGSSSHLLKSWISELKHPDRVRIIGQVLPDEVPSIIAHSDIVLIPSMSEGLPNVAVEACASGKLVLASRVGGIPEIIKDGETGFLLDAGDTEQWAAKIAHVVSNYNEYVSIGLRARQFVTLTFDNAGYPGRLLSIYRKFGE